MYYYAYINESNICTGVYAMPSELNVPGYIAITESQYNTQSVVGMYFNEETGSWEAPVTWYYAVLNERDIVTNVVDAGQETIAENYIRINALDQSLVGMVYDRTTQQFRAATFKDIAAHSTDDINVGSTDESLTARLAAISAAGSGSGSGTPGSDGADGADGEDGGYYTPAVSADGTLSWTASKDGMPAVAPANIKGSDGQDGAPGAEGAPGINGVTFTPVMTGTVLSWTNDGGLTNPASVDLKGDKGDAGDSASVDSYTKTETDNLLAGKADSTHSHDYAAPTHTHGTGDITGLTAALNGKADTNHTHTEYATSTHTHSNYATSTHTHTGYASSSHTHSNYFPTSGGTITGETNFSGGLIRAKGVQAVFHSGSQLVYGSNNLPTRIAGSAISATKTITVDSDRTLKENIADVNAADCLNFIDALDVKTYNYIGDAEPCIGLIAQDIEDFPLAKYLVRTTAEGKKAVKVADLVFPLIVAVQALSDYVKRLEK